MPNTKTIFAQVLNAAPRALMFISLIALPLMAVESVRTGGQNIIEGTMKRSSGAGLVLIVSLKRAR